MQSLKWLSLLRVVGFGICPARLVVAQFTALNGFQIILHLHNMSLNDGETLESDNGGKMSPRLGIIHGFPSIIQPLISTRVHIHLSSSKLPPLYT